MTARPDASATRSAAGNVEAMSLHASQARVVWADEDGEFVLAGGGYGNPGCDGCGMADAIVAVDGTYLCASDAIGGVDNYGLERCSNGNHLAGADPTITDNGGVLCAACASSGVT